MAYQPNYNNVVSTVNSSTTPLVASGTFTGEWEDVSAYDSVIVAVKTDQNGTFQIQFSPDGTNVDSSLTRYYRTAAIEPPHRFTITRSYCRIVFNNLSESDQTYFRLQTTFGDKTELNSPTDSVIAQDFDAISTRPTDFGSEVALGRRQGMTTWNKFGYNEDVDNAAEEIIASWGGAMQILDDGETLDIVSTSTDDDSGQSGVQQMIIWGVDENWDPQIEIVTMDGTTTVTTATSWLGINRMSIYLAGTAKANVGTITASATTSGYTMAQMPAGQGTTQQCIFYVPTDHQFLASWLYIDAIKSSGGGSPEVTVYCYVFSAVANATFEVFRDGLDTGVYEHLDLRPPEPFVIGPKSILWLEAGTSANDTSIRGRISGKLIKNVDAA